MDHLAFEEELFDFIREKNTFTVMADHCGISSFVIVEEGSDFLESIDEGGGFRDNWK